MLNRIFGLTARRASSATATWQSIFGDFDTTTGTDSGVRINGEKALEYAPVWQAVSMISGDLAGLPLEVLRRDGNDGRAPDKTHPAYRLLARTANNETEAYFFWRSVVVHLLIWNRAYSLIVRDTNATPIELLPLLPDRTEAKRDEAGRLYYVSEIAGNLQAFKAADILHFKGLSTDATEGTTLVQKARNSWALGLAAEKFGSKFFKNGARASGVLQYPKKLDERALKNLRDSFNKSWGGLENVAKVAVLEEGAKFMQTAINPNEAQFIETREEQVREVSRWFNLDPSRLGVSGSTSYNSAEEANRRYWQSCLMPWSEVIRWQCWTKLLTEDEKARDSHIIEHNTKALLTGDTKTQAEVEVLYQSMGVRSANDIARTHNFKPVGPDGDKHYISANLIPTDQPRTPAPEPAPEPAPAPASDTDRQALLECLRRTAKRVAHQAQRQATSGARFCRWLDKTDDTDSTGTGGRVAELEAKLVSEIRECLEAVANTCTEGELYEAVKHAATHCIETLPEKLTEGE